MYLSSVLKNDRKCSKISNSQLVYMSSNPGAPSIWRVLRTSCGKQGGVERLLSEGTAVQANSGVVLQHRMTAQALSADKAYVDATDFGPEFEVCCNLKQSTGKSHQLVSEFSGISTGETASRSEQVQNNWMLCTAPDPKMAEDNRNLPEPMTGEALLKKAREIINQRGNYGIRGLGRSFRIMDDAGDGRLDREDFKWGLYDYGIHFDDEQFEDLLDMFDKNGDGLISFDEFLVTIRGPLNERRQKLIYMAYDVLDKDGSGQVTRKDIEAAYDTSEHPQVISGEKTSAEVITEFMEQWETQKADGIVTKREWYDYYDDISASIDDDDYFELMIRNAWHISGGEGWCANTSCRRVLVIYNDGTQEVVEIEDDIGLRADDIQGMLDRLEKQGVKNIKKISLAD